MDYLAKKLIYDSKINHRKKLVHIFTPKCGGSSVTEWLHMLDPNDEWQSYPTLCKSIPREYTSFATVRNPVDWVLSGYKMYVQRYDLKISFEEHTELILNPIPIMRGSANYINKNFQWGDYWWHCGITPDMHLLPNTYTFKIENIESLQRWLCRYYRNAVNVPMIHTNTTKNMDIDITQVALSNISKKMHYYAERYKYK